MFVAQKGHGENENEAGTASEPGQAISGLIAFGMSVIIQLVTQPCHSLLNCFYSVLAGYRVKKQKDNQEVAESRVWTKILLLC